ncbi:hypothetical protein [Actinomyces bowdenii]|uniref:Uncharacterized protein n=1 Tax=Actinomyces bowdenii TaxID=131109 RepID=A0A3P1V6I6_9ACTO|nr:hypothetical protein [Actinomyces bowdenii]RRD29266.1 hypothetical protein EII10_07065 [Actinomyces bowdenii]
MPILRRRAAARPPADLLALVEERVLGAVPLAQDDSSWAVATAHHLVVLSRGAGAGREDDAPGPGAIGPGPYAERHGWDEVEHGSWDAGERAFTLRWTRMERPDLVLRVPAGVRRETGYVECDVEPFARALRQRVEAAIIHSATTTLPSGAPASASIRRDARGRLYSITRPAHCPDEADAAALRELEKRAADGVGLPTA